MILKIPNETFLRITRYGENRNFKFSNGGTIVPKMAPWIDVEKSMAKGKSRGFDDILKRIKRLTIGEKFLDVLVLIKQRQIH